MNDRIQFPCNTKQGYLDAYEGDGVVMSRPLQARGTVQKQMSPTLTCTTGGGAGVVTKDNSDLRIRYLTPRECLRLQAFDDGQIDKLMSAVPSRNQQYKLAGNSIAVCCLEAIFRGIYLDDSFIKGRPKQVSLMDYSESSKSKVTLITIRGQGE